MGKVPDPARCVFPKWIRIVGSVHGGSVSDPLGAATIIIRDFANNPEPYATVTLDFSACCDIELCSATPGYDCARHTVTGVTGPDGRITMTVLGAARDPGNRLSPQTFGGAGLNGILVEANTGVGDVWLGNATAVTLDLNGAGGGSNGTTGADVSNLANLVGGVALGAPYLGRGDINFDGQISASDVAALITQVGRLALEGGVGCSASFCPSAACP